MKKVLAGLCGGIVGAIIHVLFLLFAPGLEREVFLSTGFSWIAIGILISVCSLKAHGAVKGMAVAMLVSISTLIYTISSSFSGAVWTLAYTLCIGALIGYLIDMAISKMEREP